MIVRTQIKIMGSITYKDCRTGGEYMIGSRQNHRKAGNKEPKCRKKTMKAIVFGLCLVLLILSCMTWIVSIGYSM